LGGLKQIDGAEDFDVTTIHRIPNWKIRHVNGSEIILIMIVLCKVYLYDYKWFYLSFCNCL